ncbi:MAG TPA: response regulator [Opitutaceae bacterium]|nr:response regulator [Opitutaceae bacterium]
MKALIIDDERPARRELRNLLADHPDVEIAGEAGNADEAAQHIATHRPDVLFLDVQMPGGSGFDLLEMLPPPHPLVVFTTAHSEHAVRAFEFNSLDYLLKPVGEERLAAALARARARLATRPPAPTVTPNGPLSEHDQVFLRSGEHCWFVPVRSIRLIEAEGNQTRLHFGTDNALQPRTLTALEERLPTSLFMRANRSQLVNLGMIEVVGEWFSRGLKVRLQGGQEVEFSRRQAQIFRERMSL